MSAVFRHEVSSHFTNLTGYVLGAFVLLFAGIYSMVYNLKSQVANFEYVMGSMAFIYLIVVPVLTMRVISEERRQKTDQLLYSLPLTTAKIVLGKYFALLVTLLPPLAVICIYPLVLHGYGDLYLPTAYAAIFGFFFLGAALIAIGLFVSSLTESQAVAAGLCFAVMIVNYFISILSAYVSSSAFASLAAFLVLILVADAVYFFMTRSALTAAPAALVPCAALIAVYTFRSEDFEGLFPTLMADISLFERFYTIVDGSLDLTSIFYFVSVGAVFVFLTVQSMEKRRWSE